MLLQRLSLVVDETRFWYSYPLALCIFIQTSQRSHPSGVKSEAVLARPGAPVAPSPQDGLQRVEEGLHAWSAGWPEAFRRDHSSPISSSPSAHPLGAFECAESLAASGLPASRPAGQPWQDRPGRPHPRCQRPRVRCRHRAQVVPRRRGVGLAKDDTTNRKVP